MKKLTPKQQAFANAIIYGMNPSEAYKTAGYSCAKMSAASIKKEAQKLLNHPNISPTIENATREATEKAVWCREIAIERLQTVNDEAYRIIKNKAAEKDYIAKDAASAFMESLDRLNKLCNVEGNEIDQAPELVYEYE